MAAMAREAMAERTRLALFVAGQRWRRLVTRVVANPLYRWRLALKVPDRLLIAPQELRTGDPTLASEIYAGRFSFAGKAVATEGRSPFELEPPSREWAEVLLGFAWLRHLRAAGTSIARQNARALVNDWISLQGGYHPLGWEPEIVARRVVSWITQAPLILQDADHTFYRAFLKSLTRQVRYLRRAMNETRDGYPRLLGGGGARLRRSVPCRSDAAPAHGDQAAGRRTRPADPARRRPHRPQPGRLDRDSARSPAAAAGVRGAQHAAARRRCRTPSTA